MQAAAALCGEGEELSYWQLMVRTRLASAVHDEAECSQVCV